VVAGFVAMIRKEGQLFGRHPLRVADAAGYGDHGGDVDAKGTIHRTALAHGALQPSDFVAFFQKGTIHFTFAPDHLAQGVSEFIGRTQAGISIIGDIDKAAFRTQPASGANAHPGSNAGTMIGIQYLTHPVHIYGRICIVFKVKLLFSSFQYYIIPNFLIENPKHETRNSKQILNSNVQMFKTNTAIFLNELASIYSRYRLGHLNFGYSRLFRPILLDQAIFGFRI
jgi:hypothetical protein